MNIKLTLVSLGLLVALAGAACTAAPAATPAEGPSPFLEGVSLAAILDSMNATPNGPRCPITSTARSHSSGGWSNGWSEASFTTSCEDTVDETTLRQAWSAGIAAELSRLGAAVTATDEASTVARATITSRWEYRSGGLRGQIVVEVLAGPEGHYWVFVRIVEPT